MVNIYNVFTQYMLHVVQCLSIQTASYRKTLLVDGKHTFTDHSQAVLLGSRLWCLTVSLSHSHWYPGPGVVLDCIDS